MKAEIIMAIAKIALASIPVIFMPRLAIDSYREAKARMEFENKK